MRVTVTGASGTLGSHVARMLEDRGHEVVRGSRTPRAGWTVVDLTDAGSLPPACRDADVIVHCATDLRRARKIEVEGVQRLRAAAPQARLVYPSIVGCDRIAFPYYKVKAAAERALAAEGGDHAIVRLTQFHEFADRLARLPIPVVPAFMRAQTIAAEDAARELVQVAEDDVQGLVGDVGGPEVHRMVDLIKARLRRDGRRRPVVRVPLGIRGFRAGHNLCPEATEGSITWAEHLG